MRYVALALEGIVYRHGSLDHRYDAIQCIEVIEWRLAYFNDQFLPTYPPEQDLVDYIDFLVAVIFGPQKFAEPIEGCYIWTEAYP